MCGMPHKLAILLCIYQIITDEEQTCPKFNISPTKKDFKFSWRVTEVAEMLPIGWLNVA